MGKWYDTKITLKKSDFQNPYHIHKISIFEKDNSSKAIYGYTNAIIRL